MRREHHIPDSRKRRKPVIFEDMKRILTEHPDVHVIVSGGQGKDEEVTEAYAMAQYLKNAGIDRERIVQEDVSVNTLENLKFPENLLKMQIHRSGSSRIIFMYIADAGMQNMQALRIRFR